jgi:hypothetical protein
MSMRDECTPSSFQGSAWVAAVGEGSRINTGASLVPRQVPSSKQRDKARRTANATATATAAMAGTPDPDVTVIAIIDAVTTTLG